MKIGSCSLIFACIVAFSILSLSLPGYADNSALQVKCVDPSGKPVDNVKVAAFSVNNNKEKIKKSDSQGIAEFTKMDNGAYRVFGHKEGFAPAFFEYIALKDASQTVTLTFAPGEDKKLYFEDPMEAQRVKTIIGQGVDALNGGKAGDAVIYFKQALQINPFSPDALYYYGSALISQANFDQGVELLKRAATLAEALSAATPPGKEDANKKLIDTVQQILKNDLPAIKGESLMKQQKYDEALKNFAEAAQNDPSNPLNYANMAIANANSKRFEEALAMIEKAIRLKPDDKTYTGLKTKISEMKAVKQENDAITKAQTVLDEGKKLFQSEDFSGAIKKYEEAKEMVAPAMQSPLWVKIAEANAKLNQPDAVIAAYKKAIELAPAEKKSEYRKSLAIVYLQNKKYDEAVEMVTETQATSSKSAEQTLLDLAKAYKDKEPALAEVIYERVIKINPNNVDVYFELGQLYYLDGKSKDSRTKEMFEKYQAVGKDPEMLQKAKDFLVIVNRRNK
jgi:tetratricopeptide (TPR) repeat protein